MSITQSLTEALESEMDNVQEAEVIETSSDNPLLHYAKYVLKSPRKNIKMVSPTSRKKRKTKQRIQKQSRKNSR